MSSEEDIFIEENLVCYRFNNTSKALRIIRKKTAVNAIQFHFMLNGSGKFIYNNGSYAMEVNEDAGLMLYNPQRELPIHVELPPKSRLVTIVIAIREFHRLFSNQGSFIPFLAKGNLDKKHYSKPSTTPLISVVLSQIMDFRLHLSVENLYYRAKVYELLSLVFNLQSDSDSGSCPVKADSQEMRKIQIAKNILIKNMQTPPTLQDLADEIGLNTKKLKLGFKQIYGHTVYGFLIEYKMEYAQKLLDKGSYNVNEVSAKVGYSTASHFISAFKNKYGTTPKRYLTSSKKIRNERNIVS